MLDWVLNVASTVWNRALESIIWFHAVQVRMWKGRTKSSELAGKYVWGKEQKKATICSQTFTGKCLIFALQVPCWRSLGTCIIQYTSSRSFQFQKNPWYFIPGGKRLQMNFHISYRLTGQKKLWTSKFDSDKLLCAPFKPNFHQTLTAQKAINRDVKKLTVCWLSRLDFTLIVGKSILFSNNLCKILCTSCVKFMLL